MAASAVEVSAVSTVGFDVKRAAMRRILMSHLASKHKILIFTLLISLVSCNKPVQTSKPSAEKAVPKTFASPSEAGAAVLAAAQSGDRASLLAIFGPGGEEILFTGDAVRDKASLRDFVTAYMRMNRWGQIKAGGQILYIGADNYAFPVPLGQNPTGQWYFDTAAGKDEILARRIGKNELTAIAACEAAAGSQKQYFRQAHDGETVKQYAQKFVSDPGKQNGLYWPATEGRPSPSTSSATSGKSWLQTPAISPHFSTAISIDPHQTRRFAILAYPAEYRNSGIMTFIIGRDGVVYQKRPGRKDRRSSPGHDGIQSLRRLESGRVALWQRNARSAVTNNFVNRSFDSTCLASDSAMANQVAGPALLMIGIGLNVLLPGIEGNHQNVSRILSCTPKCRALANESVRSLNC